MASTYVKQCQQIIREYRLAGRSWPAKKVEIAEWALSHEKWEVPREGKLRMCADDLGEAMRAEYLTDDTGRRVRAKHPAKLKRDEEIGTFWDDIRTAPADFMRVSVAQRRNGIVAECRQVSNDVRYFNSLHPDVAPIQFVLDFTNDVRELDELRAA